ncbi:LysR family transcriptional regulator [Streptomyces sp. NPDC002143]
MGAKHSGSAVGADTVDAGYPPSPTPTAGDGGGSFDNRLTFQKLEVFCAVVDLGGVSRAAKHLWVAQPVVTAHVKSLERRLGGTTLLYRDGHEMRLTPAGRSFYRWASETLSSARQMMGELESAAREDARSRVTVAASMCVGSYLLPGILAQFQVNRPDAAISLAVSDSEQALSAVELGNSDLAVTIADGAPNFPGLIGEVIGHEAIVAVAAPDHPLPLEALTGEVFAGLPLIAPPRAHIRRELVDRQLALHGVHPRNIVMELGHPEAMKRAAEAGLGVCFLFRSSVERELLSGSLKHVELKGIQMKVPIVASVRRGQPRSALQVQLLDEIRRRLADPEENP